VKDSTLAFILANMTYYDDMRRPMGILQNIEKDSQDKRIENMISEQTAKRSRGLMLLDSLLLKMVTNAPFWFAACSKRWHRIFRIYPKNHTMEKQQVKGSWNEFKGKLKQKYANLTDDDLLYDEGQQDELFGRLQKKLGKTKEQIKQEIDKL
jgi:uncharacterized protein YjbJ (UPF0337 family)